MDLSYNKPRYSTVISCGCQLKRRQSELNSHLTHVAGTCVEIVQKRKRRSDNATGYTGVYAVHNGYKAALSFQGKTYYLGRYLHFEDAVRVRQAAEIAVYDCFLEYFGHWKIYADKDAEWSKNNPIYVEVVKTGNTLRLNIWPVLPPFT